MPETKIITSKLSSRRDKNEFYRYYAGYPLSFALWALEHLGLEDGSTVLDPWNGSGTTVAACASLGLSCFGYDINPVMVHLGRARVASDEAFYEARNAIHNIQATTTDKSIGLSKIGVQLSRTLELGTPAHSCAVASLFPFARASLREARTKNPSWFKSGVQIPDEVGDEQSFFEDWNILLTKLSAWRNGDQPPVEAELVVREGDSRRSLHDAETFDAVLTSPPYLTRLDYVQATLPESLLLGQMVAPSQIKELRRSMIGSPLTTDRPRERIDSLPQSIKNLLDSISRHPSKASSSYYIRFFSSYFVDLRASMENIARSLKTGAPACIVVQPSHYKEIEVDLANAVVALGQQFGLYHQYTVDFDARRSMSLVNSRAHELARKPKSESAVFLSKE